MEPTFTSSGVRPHRCPEKHRFWPLLLSHPYLAAQSLLLVLNTVCYMRQCYMSRNSATELLVEPQTSSYQGAGEDAQGFCCPWRTHSNPKSTLCTLSWESLRLLPLLPLDNFLPRNLLQVMFPNPIPSCPAFLLSAH